jgi:hypothetical protein
VNVKEFDSASAGFTYIKAENAWNQRTTIVNDIGKRIYFYCKYFRACSVKLCMFLPNTSLGVQIQQTQAEHNHEIKGTGIPQDIQNQIKELFAVGITKPNAILKALRGRNVIEWLVLPIEP